MSQAPGPLWSIITNRFKLAGLLMILLPVLLVTLDNTILNFALPKIAVALGPSAAEQLWVIDAYSLVLAGLLITMGTLGDRVGYRRLLCVGCTGFAIISIAIVFSRQAWHLIAGRAVLGLFGAMILPATLALIRTVFDDREERRIAVAAWATCLTLGAAAGPLLGGVLLQFFSWQSVFLVAVPFLLPMLLLSPMIPESPRQAGLSIDYVSILLSLGAMTGVMLSLKHLATVGVDAYAIVGMVVGLGTGIAFVQRQRRLEEPLLDLELFDSSTFSVSITVNLVSLGALIGFLFFATQLLQLVLGLSPIAASLILVPGQVCAVAAGLAIVPIAQRVAPNVVIPACLYVAAGAFAVMALFTATALIVGVAFVLLNAAVAAITSVSNDLVLSAVPADKAGSASSVSETAYEVGVVLGTSLVGGAVAAGYRLSLVLPGGIEDDAAALAVTLGGAHSLAQDLPAEAGAVLAEAANTAFSGGVAVTSGLVAGLIVLFALYARWGLRRA